MGRFIKIENHAFLKDNINKISLDDLKFPVLSEKNNADKFSKSECNVLCIDVKVDSGTYEKYIFYNSVDLDNAIISVNKYKKDDKKIFLNNHFDTEEKTFIDTFYTAISNIYITFIYTHRDINELYEEITDF